MNQKYARSAKNIVFNTSRNIFWILVRIASLRYFYQIFKTCSMQKYKGVVECGEGVVYLTSLERPTDIGLQLGKACYPWSR